jgi:lipoate-protein ligase A
VVDVGIKTKIVRSHSFDPWFNIALEEKLLQDLGENEIILYLWQNDNTVVIGRNQNAWKECAWEQLEKDGGKLARRLSGGGAVYHDLGNLNFTFLAPRKYYDIEKQLTVILAALRNLGVNPEFSGRNDLLLDGKKFSGHAYYYQSQAAYHHGTIMVHSDIEKLVKYLNPSKKKMVAKGVDSVRSRVTNIAEEFQHITILSVMESFMKSFSELYQEPEDKMDIYEDEPELMGLYEKFASWSWRFGQSPLFDIYFSERFSWGEIDLMLHTLNGKIDSCTVYSDAMDEELIRRISPALLGSKLEKESLLQALDSLISVAKDRIIIDDLKTWIACLEL